LGFALFDGGALVVQFFALGEADLDLGESFFVEPDLMQKLSLKLALPLRRALTSVPVNTIPASYLSSMKYSWNAERFLISMHGAV